MPGPAPVYGRLPQPGASRGCGHGQQLGGNEGTYPRRTSHIHHEVGNLLLATLLQTRLEYTCRLDHFSSWNVDLLPQLESKGKGMAIFLTFPERVLIIEEISANCDESSRSCSMAQLQVFGRPDEQESRAVWDEVRRGSWLELGRGTKRSCFEWLTWLWTQPRWLSEESLVICHFFFVRIVWLFQLIFCCCRLKDALGFTNSTDSGRTASTFYMKYDTIDVFNELLKLFWTKLRSWMPVPRLRSLSRSRFRVLTSSRSG